AGDGAAGRMSCLRDMVRAALGDVYDPCSVAAAAPVSIVDMGLVTAIEADCEGRVSIQLRATSPMCTLVASLAQAAEQQAAKVPGVSAVAVHVDSSSLWTENDLSDAERKALEARGRRSAVEVRVARRQWQGAPRRDGG